MDFGSDAETGGYAEYVNVPASIGMVVSAGKATMAELATVLSLEDVADLVEIIQVDSHNRRVADRRREDR